jgi:putative protein kinase ArgK-like GTPase of G3E family
VAELRAALAQHQAWLTQSGRREVKLREFLKNELTDILTEKLQRSLEVAFQSSSGQSVLADLMARKLDPYQAADLISQGSGAGKI